MTHTQHTPGPWRICSKSLDGKRHYITVGTDENNVADVIGFADKEECANARLIAAAPELLEALELAKYEMQCCSKAEHDEAFTNALSKIDAAIAKARGQSC